MSTNARFDERSGNKVLQDMCDEVFGEGAVNIEKWWGWNDVTILLSFPVDFASFIKNFKARLERLRNRFEHKESYGNVLATVAQLAEKKRCWKAYAKLAAWDIMWNNYLMLGMEVNEQGRGHLTDFGMYFDVGLLANILDGAELKRTMKDGLYVQVLVNPSCYMYKKEQFAKMKTSFYEMLAHHTFIENKKAMKNLAGFIIIDDGLDRDWNECRIYMNPNANRKSELADFYLETLNCGRDDLGILGSFLDYMSGAL
jgi:hypothetical protein